MQWTQDQERIIIRFRGHLPTGPDLINSSLKDNLRKIPENERQYKCGTCHSIFGNDGYVAAEKRCPECGETHVFVMCPLDHCHCEHRRPISGIAYCPICGDPICPECGTHDVYQISRVTGYLQDVSGWNAGKQQELKDRHRVNIE